MAGRGVKKLKNKLQVKRVKENKKRNPFATLVQGLMILGQIATKRAALVTFFNLYFILHTTLYCFFMNFPPSGKYRCKKIEKQIATKKSKIKNLKKKI